MSLAEQKTERLRAALSHREGDRVPVGEFFWTGFVNRCKAKWGNDFDPYRHFDLDYVVIGPNMDPKIQPFEIIEQKGDDIVVKTGFGATIRRRGDLPMPHFEGFSVNRPEEMENFQFEPPEDPRRFFAGGDDQLNCVGDALARDLPSWDERLCSYEGDFALFGSVCEPYEMLWRIIGSQNALYWLATDADRVQAFIDRIGKFMLEFLRAQIAAAKGRLSGVYIWGDVAYVKGMFFGAPRWRTLLKPHVKALIDLCHQHKLMTIYHGCGDARAIYEDFVEIGLDGYNPLEAKAHLDAVELKKQYGGRLAFVGNVDVRELESGDPQRIEREVRYKLQAAKGGGWICQSDHSVTSRVAPESYELAVQTLRRWGNYPLRG
jgi:uroporphyrinogen decarboxylase